jgi:hypothetical protein
MSIVSASMPYEEYQLPVSTSPSAGELLAFKVPNDRQKLIVEAITTRVYLKFGGSSVVSSYTLTGNKLPSGVWTAPTGALIEIDLPAGGEHQYVSVVCASGTATAILKLCSVDSYRRQ